MAFEVEFRHSEAFDALMCPRVVAVVGASRRTDALGRAVIENLHRLQFQGRVYPVNPHYDEVEGHTCYPSLETLPEKPDAVFVALPAPLGGAVVDEAGKLGVRAAYVNANGYADGGPEGQELQKELVNIAETHGMVVCGPNNTGILNFRDHVAMWTAPMPRQLGTTGSAAVISQSGSVAMVLSEGLRSLGLRYVISAGNEAVATAADYLRWVVQDRKVRVVLLFLETIRAPEKFRAAASEAVRCGIPIVALKVGRSVAGERAVGAHTGALAGNDAAYDAFLQACGVIRTADLDELIQTANLYGHLGVPSRAGGVGIVTLSGGEAALVADIAAEVGLQLPFLDESSEQALGELLPDFQRAHNPLDGFGLGFRFDTFSRMLEALDRVPDTVLTGAVIDAPASGGADADYGVEVADWLSQKNRDLAKPTLIISGSASSGIYPRLVESARESNTPLLVGMRPALGALASWCRYTGPEVSVRRDLPEDVTGALASVWSESDPDWFSTLVRAGVPVVPTRLVHSVQAAVQAAGELGYPVALKAGARGVIHKSDLGLVALNLEGAAVVAQWASEFWKRVAEEEGGHLLVQKMVADSIETFVGSRCDSQLGQVVAVGTGGVAIEVLQDVVVRMGPVTEDTALQMLAATALPRLMKRTGRHSDADLRVAARIIAQLSQVAAALHPRVTTLEINPLLLPGEGKAPLCADVVVD